MGHLTRLFVLSLLLATLILGTMEKPAAAEPPAAGVIDPNASNLSPEEQLALRYAPIAYLKVQTAPCDANGEPYEPGPVDLVLNDDQVVLRQRSDAKKSINDPIVKTAPAAADLAGKDSSYYIDLPGDPLHGGCGYEKFSKARMGDQQPMVYAHIATEAGHDGFALQYWFYYVFNRFNNLHESDWEMIQLTFDDKTVEQALAPSSEPDAVAFAQHGGGETADWDSDKLQKEDGHPVVYPAAGSHAAYYDNYLYIGWGERGSGLGCDDSSGPSERVPLAVSLMPDQPNGSGAFSWLTFSGRWGQRENWEFNGPTGPQTKSQWNDPFDWQDGLRTSSLPLLSSSTIGPSPTRIFCSAVSLGADFIVFHDQAVSASYVLLGLIILIPLLVVALAWRTLTSSLRMFMRHAVLFLALGAVLFAIGTADNVTQHAILSIPLVGEIFDLLNIPINQGLFLVSGSGVQQLAGWLLVTPAVVFAVIEIQAGRKPSFRQAVRYSFSIAATVVKASAVTALIITALVLSIVGIPWAIHRVVRWTLLIQAIVLDHAPWREARKVSAAAVQGRWWRTACVVAALTIINALLAPLAGIVVLIFVTPSTFAAQTVSNVLYALLFPMVGIAMTLWRQQRTSLAASR